MHAAIWGHLDTGNLTNPIVGSSWGYSFVMFYNYWFLWHQSDKIRCLFYTKHVMTPLALLMHCKRVHFSVFKTVVCHYSGEDSTSQRVLWTGYNKKISEKSWNRDHSKNQTDTDRRTKVCTLFKTCVMKGKIFFSPYFWCKWTQ